MLDQLDSEAPAKTINDLYMYKFRTKHCNRGRQCNNPSACFDAHSKLMKRRVPRLVDRGLFSYSPIACQEWQRSKKCGMGERCTRAHGWTEIIFHPLRYKTKLCKSKHQNGVCSRYGIHCANACTPRGIRCLDEIYGKNWKGYCEVSEKQSANKNYHPVRASTSRMKRRRQHNKQRVGVAVPPKTCHIIDVNLFAHYLLNGQTFLQDQPPICLEQHSLWCETDSDIPFEELDSAGGSTELCLSDEKLTSYTQMYSATVTSNKNPRTQTSPSNDTFTSQQVEGSQSIASPTQYSNMTLSDPVSPVLEEWGSSRAISGSECGRCFQHSDQEILASQARRTSKIYAETFMNLVHRNCTMARLL